MALAVAALRVFFDSSTCQGTELLGRNDRCRGRDRGCGGGFGERGVGLECGKGIGGEKPVGRHDL